MNSIYDPSSQVTGLPHLQAVPAMGLYGDQRDDGGQGPDAGAVYELNYNRLPEGSIRYGGERALQHEDLQQQSGSRGHGQITPTIITVDQSHRSPESVGPLNEQNGLRPKRLEIRQEKFQDRLQVQEDRRPRPRKKSNKPRSRAASAVKQPTAVIDSSDSSEFGTFPGFSAVLRKRPRSRELGHVSSVRKKSVSEADTDWEDGHSESSQEVPLTHYTISEDKTATSVQKDKLYAINSESKSNLLQPVEGILEQVTEPPAYPRFVHVVPPHRSSDWEAHDFRS